MDSYMSIHKTAELWGCSERNVQILCRRGAIPGAKKISGVWLLPVTAVRERIKAVKPSTVLRAEQLYGKNAKVHCIPDSSFQQHDGSGCLVTQYQILEGITLVFQDIHEERLEYGSEMPQFPANLIAIQHCREGRFEGEYPDGECIYMGPGSLALNLPAWSPVTNSFPLHHYHGFYIAIFPDIANSAIVNLEQLLGPMGIDLSALPKRLSGKNRLSIYAADEEIKRLISSMYDAYSQGRVERLRIQVLALLQLLCRQEPLNPEKNQYFPREQVITVKKIRNCLVSHLDQHIPLPELASRFHISLTAMKICFKGVYGQSIGKYLREYRMQAGAEKLRNTRLKIVEIAASLGYENSSKFSEAFTVHYGINPSTYRKNFCPQGVKQSVEELK